jgi:hypothetical protein
MALRPSRVRDFSRRRPCGLIAATGRILAEPRGTIGTPRTNRIGSAPRTGLAITGKPRYGPPIP